MDVDLRISQYLEIRETMRAEQKVWDERKAALTLALDKLEGTLGAYLRSTNQKSLVGASGTCYTSEVWSATVADPSAFRDFVRETGNMDLLKIAANPTTVRAYVEENSALPPGVNLTSKINVNVRKSANHSSHVTGPVTENGDPQ